MAAGRPTTYDEKYCEEILQFFNREPWELAERKVWTKDEGVQVIKVSQPCQLPTFERFASNIGVHFDTLHEWKKKHPKFSDAFKICKQLQQEILVQHALSGHYKEGFAKFLAVNITKLRDKVPETYNDEIEIDDSDD